MKRFVFFRKRFVSILATAVLVMGCVRGANRATTIEVTSEAELVFTHHQQSLVLLRANGDRRIGLGSSGKSLIVPRFSPNGQQIACYDLGTPREPESTTRVTLHIVSWEDDIDGVEWFSIPLPMFNVDHPLVVDDVIAPVWEPDGRSFLAAHTAGVDRVFLSGVHRPLVTDAHVLALAPTPDGAEVAFSTRENIFRFDSKNPQPIAILENGFVVRHTARYIRALAFAPDAGRLAFGLGGALWIYDFASEEPYKVLDAKNAIYWIAWDIVGERIFYVSGRERPRSPLSMSGLRAVEGRYQVESVSLSDGVVRRLLEEHLIDVREAVPQLSPDGQYISVTGRDGAHKEIFLIATDGSGVSLLTSDGPNSHAAWRPR